MTMALEQKKVNELVDRFYDKLLKDSYYINMFNERNTDIELLKNRQRVFINRLVSEASAQEEGSKYHRLKKVTPFKYL
ncbi:protoglobin domain-containing protein [Neobacillus drentensis]|uniref:protoglobin domain-containing protein n=1 Tax=Neobacillus drentensis TaxID=220684 RepID=UPI0030026276